MSVPKISWHSFNLRSGRRGISLVTQQKGTLKRIIGEPTDTTLAVSCSNDGAPRPEWDQATQPGTTMLVALDEESEQIIWGGMVLRRVSDPTEWVNVSLMTLEHYFERRFVGDLGFIDADQMTIAAGLLDELDVDGLDFTVDAPVSGTLLTRTYAEQEDKTVLSALTELVEVEDGIEFTVDLEWVDDTHTQIERIVRISDRIGTSPTIPTQWTMPGCITDFELIEDYTAEYGANDVLAVSSGEGESRPESGAEATDLIAAGWARFQMHYTAAASITDFVQLAAHANAKLTDVKNGLSQFSFVANLDSAPRLNVDWHLGDDIEAALICPRFPEHAGTDGEMIPGFVRRQRAVGWEIDHDARTLTPLTREVA